MTTIVVDHLTKRYGAVTAVDDLSFTLEPGTVTGFVGANGAGKSTTLRMLLGLTHPTSGTVTIDGRRYVDLAHPARTVGALTDPDVFHPRRRGRDALRVVAAASGVSASRVDQLLELVGLGDAGHRRVGGYSMGMRQRLALAVALLGDPPVVVLDEPTNGLDPLGIAWLRSLIRSLGAEGRTVLVSSHQLAELGRTVDDLVVIDHGRLVARGPVTALLDDTDRSGSLEDLFLGLIQKGHLS
jgi:ABC-2 type transport system ATP-binding protein